MRQKHDERIGTSARAAATSSCCLTIRAGSAGSWDAAKGAWKIEVYDSADNHWPLVVDGKKASSLGRLEALQKSVDELYRKALS